MVESLITTQRKTLETIPEELVAVKQNRTTIMYGFLHRLNSPLRPGIEKVEAEERLPTMHFIKLDFKM
jgi:hypothetical protein